MDSDIEKGVDKLVFQLKRNYSWAFGSPPVKADVVGETIEKLERETGSVTSEGLLNVSRDADSPTHALFEWDDGVAGEKYRLYQARQVIRNLNVEIVEQENAEPRAVSLVTDADVKDHAAQQPVKKVRAFVSIDHRPGILKPSNFMSIDTALSDSQYREVVISDALSQFKALESKYYFLNELADIFAAIDNHTTGIKHEA